MSEFHFGNKFIKDFHNGENCLDSVCEREIKLSLSSELNLIIMKYRNLLFCALALALASCGGPKEPAVVENVVAYTRVAI